MDRQEQDELTRRAKEWFEQPAGVEAYGVDAEHGPTGWEADALRMLPPPPARILDLGCGAGRIAIPLAAQGYDVTAIDVSRPLVDHALRLAEARGVPLTGRAGDAIDVGAEPSWGRFDGVLSIKQLCYLPGRDLRQRQLQVIRRSLRPGGMAIVTSHVVPSIEEAERELRSDAQHQRFADHFTTLEPLDTFSGEGGYVHWFTEASLVAELTEASFTVDATTRSDDGLQIAIVLS